MMNNYDAIVIGSGIGGLTAASLLAQLGDKRVLVLERHFRLGGFTHTFSRKGYTWDVGVHYVGGMAEGSQMRGLFDLVTRAGVSWQPLPGRFEVFHYPDLTFRVPNNPERYLGELIAAFPREEQALRRYQAAISSASRPGTGSRPGVGPLRRSSAPSRASCLHQAAAWPSRPQALELPSTPQTGVGRRCRFRRPFSLSLWVNERDSRMKAQV